MLLIDDQMKSMRWMYAPYCSTFENQNSNTKARLLHVLKSYIFDQSIPDKTRNGTNVRDQAEFYVRHIDELVTSDNIEEPDDLEACCHLIRRIIGLAHESHAYWDLDGATRLLIDLTDCFNQS